VDITAAIAAQSELLVGYGGHTMAAGFAIERENIPAFRRAISRFVAEFAIPEKDERLIDAEVPLSEISLEFVEDLERLAPFGAGNPPLVFASQDVKVVGWSTIGRAKEHLSIKIEDEHNEIKQAFWWGGGDHSLEKALKNKKIDICYKARASTFLGDRDVQIEWVDYRVPEGEDVVPEQLKISLEDYRQEKRPLSLLRQMGHEWQVWAEADAGGRLKESGLSEERMGLIRGRDALTQGENLAIWTIPPGMDELRSVLCCVDPRKVILFAVDPQTDHEEQFLQRLAGLVKYSIRQQDGRTSLAALSIAMAHRERTVEVGLQWLASAGQITFELVEDGDLDLADGDDASSDENAVELDTLRTLLEETRAFRNYYKRVKGEQLFRKN